MYVVVEHVRIHEASTCDKNNISVCILHTTALTAHDPDLVRCPFTLSLTLAPPQHRARGVKAQRHQGVLPRRLGLLGPWVQCCLGLLHEYCVLRVSVGRAMPGYKLRERGLH